MIWCSGWRLAAAVSEAGGLGTLGAGSMYPEVLRDQIQKVQAATSKPFAVNLPLLYPNIEEHLQSCIDLKVPVVITSAGNPKLHTERLKAHGIRVLHVVSSAKFAIKAAAAGVDAVIAEGFEAGGAQRTRGNHHACFNACGLRCGDYPCSCRRWNCRWPQHGRGAHPRSGCGSDGLSLRGHPRIVGPRNV